MAERQIVLPPVLRIGVATVPQSHMNDPPKPIDLRPCSKCGGPTWLACSEPSDKADYDLRTFECSRCEQSEMLTVKFK